LQGREPGSLSDLAAELKQWVWSVANQRKHGTTHEIVIERWEAELAAMHALDGRPAYPYVDEETRKVARDAFVNWNGSRYSVPWQYVGKEVWVRPQQDGTVEIRYGAQRIAQHLEAGRKHQVMRQHEHHAGIPLGARPPAKTLLQLRETAPVVEIRSLAAYESVAAAGGAQ
jgi:hypothetical protein